MKNKYSIVLIDDDPSCQLLVSRALGQSFSVISASTGKAGLETLKGMPCDLLLLDIGLPDIDGLHLYSQMTEDERLRSIPTMFLTGKSEVSYKVLGLNLGAEDYVVKPFHPTELHARVASRIRNIEKTNSKIIQAGDLKVDLVNQTVCIGSHEESVVSLTPVELRLLCALIKSGGQVMSRQDLIKSVWHKISVSDRTVDKHLTSLRKKIPYFSDCIKSNVGVGYEFRMPSNKKAA